MVADRLLCDFGAVITFERKAESESDLSVRFIFPLSAVLYSPLLPQGDQSLGSASFDRGIQATQLQDFTGQTLCKFNHLGLSCVEI